MRFIPLSRVTTVRSFTGMDRNGPNYRNGLPEWTLICALKYDLCILLEQNGLGMSQNAISPRNMQFRWSGLKATAVPCCRARSAAPYYCFPFAFIKNRFNSVSFKLYVSHIIYSTVVSKTEN